MGGSALRHLRHVHLLLELHHLEGEVGTAFVPPVDGICDPVCVKAVEGAWQHPSVVVHRPLPHAEDFEAHLLGQLGLDLLPIPKLPSADERVTLIVDALLHLDHEARSVFAQLLVEAEAVPPATVARGPPGAHCRIGDLAGGGGAAAGPAQVGEVRVAGFLAERAGPIDVELTQPDVCLRAHQHLSRIVSAVLCQAVLHGEDSFLGTLPGKPFSVRRPDAGISQTIRVLTQARLGRILQGLRLLLHHCHNKVFVLLQRVQRPFKRLPSGGTLHGCQHDLFVSPKALIGVLRKPAALLHGHQERFLDLLVRLHWLAHVLPHVLSINDVFFHEL
mmetsp:Transcript_12387/g.23772  ORF Transcript_12387/g.23772 Transcript_12387/m.23772 type:complete len:332 (-) Transcript_12387:528-1523(-)